jgi:hypothetical protein
MQLQQPNELKLKELCSCLTDYLFLSPKPPIVQARHIRPSPTLKELQVEGGRGVTSSVGFTNRWSASLEGVSRRTSDGRLLDVGVRRMEGGGGSSPMSLLLSTSSVTIASDLKNTK